MGSGVSTVLVTSPSGYTELVISCLVVAVTIATTHYTYARRDGQAELAGWLNNKTVYL